MTTPIIDLAHEIKLDIKNKLDYYLGDENLKHDVPLREKILSNPDGYIDLEELLHYEDIKEKLWTAEELRKGVELSQLVELDSTGDKIRRKDNLKLPELSLLSQKRKEEDVKMENEKEKGDKKDFIILKINCKEKTTIPLKNILDEFKKLNPDLDVKYEYFKDNIGYFAILLKKLQSIDDSKIVNKFTIEQTEFNLKKCEGEELSKFLNEHGTEFEIIAKEKIKNEAKPAEPKKRKEIILGGKKFCNIGLVKMEVNSILSKSKPDEKLVGRAKDFVLDLCSYHKNFHDKIKDPDYVMVSTKEKNKYLKCFYIVDKNQNKVHFSSRQCIDNFIANLNGE